MRGPQQTIVAKHSKIEEWPTSEDCKGSCLRLSQSLAAIFLASFGPSSWVLYKRGRRNWGLQVPKGPPVYYPGADGPIRGAGFAQQGSLAAKLLRVPRCPPDDSAVFFIGNLWEQFRLQMGVIRPAAVIGKDRPQPSCL